MKRRAFFQNLVGSFAVLVSAYATPLMRFKRDAVSNFLNNGASFDQISFGPNCWVGLVRRGKFPEGMGETIRVLTYERIGETWSNNA